MNLNEKNISCQTEFWALALGIGLVTIIPCVLFGVMGWTGTIFLGLGATGVYGLMLGWTICLPLTPLRNEVLSEQAAGVLDEQSSSKVVTLPANDATKPETAEIVDPVMSSVALAGEVELAERKDDWKYQPNCEPENNPVTQATQEAPSRLDAPIGGIAYDPKKIKGVDTKLEKLCNSMGFHHFSQVAAWTAQDVAWADDNLVGFKGWVTHDNWADQAKALASAGATDFGKPTEEGGV